jgi:hypothetical protein
MAHVGQTLEHPLTGERLTFLETAASTGGEKLRIAVEMAPGGALSGPHLHVPCPPTDSATYRRNARGHRSREPKF